MLLALIRKELLALSRDLHGLAALFLMPVMFIIVMSLALKDVYTPPKRSMPHAFHQQDQGELTTALMTEWRARHGVAQALPADWQAQLRSGRLKYVIELQPGLSKELEQPSLPLKPRIRLLAEPGIDASTLAAMSAELVGLSGELKARHAMAQSEQPAPAGASMETLVQTERFASAGPRPSAVQQNVPAWLVFGMFFVIASLASLFVEERACGAWARLQSLGVPRRVMLASKALPYLGVNAVQAALMLAVGVWLMPLIGGDALSLRGIDWPALLLAIAAIALASVSMALALACLVRTHAQAGAIGPIVNVLMAAIGGIMVPKFVMPDFMQRLAEWSPMNWGLEALLGVLLRGGDITSTWPQLLRLLAFAAIMSLVALIAFRRTLR